MRFKSDKQRRAVMAKLHSNPPSNRRKTTSSNRKSFATHHFEFLTEKQIPRTVEIRGGQEYTFNVPANDYYQQARLRKEITGIHAELYGVGLGYGCAKALRRHREDITAHKKGSVKYRYHHWRIKSLQKKTNELENKIKNKQRIVDTIEQKYTPIEYTHNTVFSYESKKFKEDKKAYHKRK